MPSASRKRRPVSSGTIVCKISLTSSSKAQEEEESSEEERPRKSQHKKGKQRAQEAEDEQEDDDDDEDGENNMDIDAGEDSHDQLVKKLVRYALACEYQRMPIRRAGISEKGWSLPI